MYFLSFVLLFLLALSKFFSCENALSFAPCNKGAIRWFVLNPKPLPEIPFVGQITFQPSELAKLALVIFLSFIFSSYLVIGSPSSKLKIKKKLVVVDVGANSGTFFDLLLEGLDIEKAVLFEPHPKLYEYLRTKYEKNNNRYYKRRKNTT